MTTADQVKATVAAYWRYVRQCPLVALEVDSQLRSFIDEVADVLVVDKNRHLIETEVKVKLGDLKRDIKKRKHRDFREGRGVTSYFYFAVPVAIANKAKDICAEQFPYAGILGIADDEWNVHIYRSAKLLSGEKLAYPKVLRMVYCQSSTVCRFARRIEELAKQERKLKEQLKYYKDMERLSLPNRDSARIDKTLARMPVIDDPEISQALRDAGL